MGALKAAEKKKKAVIDKEKREHERKENKKKKKNSKTPEIKVWNFRKEDFLVKDYLEASKEIESNYNFSDYSDDETEVFEDSKENLSDEEFLTPIQFASVFGRKQAALSTSTPNLPTQAS